MNHPSRKYKLHFVIGLILLSMIAGLQSCSEFFSQNVEELVLKINSPADSLFAANHQITFWWEADNRVENYHLQVVRPDFSNPIHITDTILLESRLSLSLDEGRYIWRIRAENAGSESAYQIHSMIIDTTSPQVPIVLFPQQGQDINLRSEMAILRWQSKDPSIDGIAFPTQDSVRVVFNKENRELGYFIGIDEEKQWDITSTIANEIEGDSLSLKWKVISFDQAGNRSESDWETFQLFKS